MRIIAGRKPLKKKFKLKQHPFPYNSFIGGWYIPEKICDDMIKFFEDHRELHEIGSVGGKEGMEIVPESKDSIDIGVHPQEGMPPFNDYRIYLQKCLEKYEKKYRAISIYSKFNLNTHFNIQKYSKGGGFKTFHFERQRPYNRVLVFMTYLNNVDDGGTRFHYQRLNCPAKKGLTILWPTDFTHLHRGIISHTQEKYIVTGWLSFS
jgi:prolyl 4-hydroxylase|tara:strand:+ start:4030 stop:4647 length:618 start_codon:yes stop_codon:yes gene_type:complete